MRRYWFEFDLTIDDDAPSGVIIGCGVTAENTTEAKLLLKDKVFKDSDFPTIVNLIEDVDISTLDAGHVLPNMGNPIVKGIWFPIGYE